MGMEVGQRHLTLSLLPGWYSICRMDAATPVYLFQKGAFLAGFAGLPEKEADPLARQFAARLN